MFTNQEVINMLKRSLALVENQTLTEKKFDLPEGGFYPFMVGYLTGDLKFVIDLLEERNK